MVVLVWDYIRADLAPSQYIVAKNALRRAHCLHVLLVDANQLGISRVFSLCSNNYAILSQIWCGQAVCLKSTEPKSSKCKQGEICGVLDPSIHCFTSDCRNRGVCQTASDISRNAWPPIDVAPECYPNQKTTPPANCGRVTLIFERSDMEKVSDLNLLLISYVHIDSNRVVTGSSGSIMRYRVRSPESVVVTMLTNSGTIRRPVLSDSVL